MTILLIVLGIVVVLAAGLVIYIFAARIPLPPETDALIEAVMNRDLPEMITGETGIANSAGLNIWYECIMPTDPPKGTVLLLIGTGGDALNWPPKFVHAFAAAGYRVVRFDYRGTGMSDWVENWDKKHPYTLADMAGDAAAVLEAVGSARTHLVGLSMGGMIAQEIALAQPARTASLTLMMTSGYVGDPDLPSLSSAYLFSNLINGLPLLRYRLAGGEKNLIKERIAKMLLVTDEVDIQETAEFVLYDLRRRRGFNLRGVWQHQTAVTISGSRIDRLRTLDVPTLVIHGTADPVFPVEHGQKLTQTIPGAKFLEMEGVGHLFPPSNFDDFTTAILAHLDNQPS